MKANMQELINKIFDEVEAIELQQGQEVHVSDDGSKLCTFEAFAQSNEAQVIVQSPVFQIEELTLPMSKSRPASSGKN